MILVLYHPGCPGKEANKQVCVYQQPFKIATMMAPGKDFVSFAGRESFKLQ